MGLVPRFATQAMVTQPPIKSGTSMNRSVPPVEMRRGVAREGCPVQMRSFDFHVPDAVDGAAARETSVDVEGVVSGASPHVVESRRVLASLRRRSDRHHSTHTCDPDRRVPGCN